MNPVRMLLAVMVAVLALAAGSAWAAIEAFEFKDDESLNRYQQLTAELRCPKCQNQNIADSNAPIAEDLRREVYRMVNDGAGNDEIVDYMVERYGEFVIYRPRFDASTFLLWFGPLILGLLGLLVILALVRSSSKAKQEAVLSGEERQKLNQLLNDQEKS